MRIRTIKPEFWTDAKIRRLGEPTALFFIALWNVADDFGYFSSDTLELSLILPRWRSQSLHRMLSSLSDHGLIQLSSLRHVGLITNWDRHQKIKDRKASKWNETEIQWDCGAKNDAPEPPEKAPGREGKGREGKGREYAQESPLLTPAKPPTSEIWKAYSEAYFSRYATEPIRNAKVNGQLAQFVCRISRDEAPLVAAFFVAHNDAFYVRAMHPIGMLLRDAEKLRTEWKTGEAMTAGRAQAIDRRQSTNSAIDRAFDSLAERGVSFGGN